ncbi:uncharacterized protein [Dysidea avara]|uniref:uncharacterized protein n=1 Tax=Dysidea avara TaxID=196820 RepID=UPI00332B16C0
MDKTKTRKKLLAAGRVQGRRRKMTLPKTPTSSRRKKKGKQRLKTTQPSVEELLDLVADCVENFEYELALQYCEAALVVAPSNINVLETTGGLLLDFGDIERATQCFLTAVEASPEDGHHKYLCLGQLSQGQDAVKYMLKGIDILIKQLHSQNDLAAASTSTQDATTFDVSTAYCSLAEVYLTDCCFDGDAEVKCGEYCTKAIEYCPSNPEAYQLMGSYLLSKQDIEKARSTLLQGLLLWLPAPDDDVRQVPSYQSQVNWSKLLMEVEEYEKAHEVLVHLLREDDEMIEVWYLLGWLAHLQNEFSVAVDCLRRCKELHSTGGCEDVQLLNHVDELLEELGDQQHSESEENLSESDQDMQT